MSNSPTGRLLIRLSAALINVVSLAVGVAAPIPIGGRRRMLAKAARLALAVSLLASLQSVALAQERERPVERPTFYRTIEIDGVSIFYREAGAKDAPTLLLLHGFPSSSRMYEPLLARLADRYHLIAPDYPGFGHSDWPDPKTFAYTFDHLASIMDRFTEALRLSHYTLYMQDYGGPVGFRLALTHPEASRRSSFRTQSRTMKAWARFGDRGGRFGPIAPQTRADCGRISCRWRRREAAMSAAIRTWIATTPIFGPTSSRS